MKKNFTKPSTVAAVAFIAETFITGCKPSKPPLEPEIIIVKESSAACETEVIALKEDKIDDLQRNIRLAQEHYNTCINGSFYLSFLEPNLTTNNTKQINQPCLYQEVLEGLAEITMESCKQVQGVFATIDILSTQQKEEVEKAKITLTNILNLNTCNNP